MFYLTIQPTWWSKIHIQDLLREWNCHHHIFNLKTNRETSTECQQLASVQCMYQNNFIAINTLEWRIVALMSSSSGLVFVTTFIYTHHFSHSLLGSHSEIKPSRTTLIITMITLLKALWEDIQESDFCTLCQSQNPSFNQLYDKWKVSSTLLAHSILG